MTKVVQDRKQQHLLKSTIQAGAAEMSEQYLITPLSSRIKSSSPLSFHHTPPQHSIKSESLSPSIKNEPYSGLASHARFSQVARSFLPGRPDLTSTTPTPSAKTSFTPVSTSPLSASVKEESSPFISRIKEESSVTSTAPSSTTSAPVFRGPPPTSQPTKPANITHLTEAEYRARVQQIKTTRDSLASAMKESLELTKRQALRHSKLHGQAVLDSTNGKQRLTATLDGLTRLTASLEIDRQVALNSMMSERSNIAKAEKKGLTADVDEAELKVLKQAKGIVRRLMAEGD